MLQVRSRFSQTTLLDDMSVVFGGIGFWHHFVMEMPADGQTALLIYLKKPTQRPTTNIEYQ